MEVFDRVKPLCSQEEAEDLLGVSVSVCGTVSLLIGLGLADMLSC